MSTDAINLGIMDHHTTPAYKRLLRNQLRTAYCLRSSLISQRNGSFRFGAFA